jgi:hypothetical protein
MIDSLCQPSCPNQRTDTIGCPQPFTGMHDGGSLAAPRVTHKFIHAFTGVYAVPQLGMTGVSVSSELEDDRLGAPRLDAMAVLRRR